MQIKKIKGQYLHIQLMNTYDAHVVFGHSSRFQCNKHCTAHEQNHKTQLHDAHVHTNFKYVLGSQKWQSIKLRHNCMHVSKIKLTQKLADEWLHFKWLKIIDMFSCTDEDDGTMCCCHTEIHNIITIIITDIHIIITIIPAAHNIMTKIINMCWYYTETVWVWVNVSRSIHCHEQNHPKEANHR